MISWELSTEELDLVNSHVITPRMVAGSVFAGFKNLKTCSYVGFHHDHASLHLAAMYNSYRNTYTCISLPLITLTVRLLLWTLNQQHLCTYTNSGSKHCEQLAKT